MECWGAGLCEKGSSSSIPSEAQSNWAARLGNGDPHRDPFLALSYGHLQLYIPSEFHSAIYMGLPPLCFRGQQATPPKNTERPKGSGWG